MFCQGSDRRFTAGDWRRTGQFMTPNNGTADLQTDSSSGMWKREEAPGVEHYIAQPLLVHDILCHGQGKKKRIVCTARVSSIQQKLASLSAAR